MPSFGDYVVCRDWQSIWNKEGKDPFGATLKPGLLYRWHEYSRNPPEPIGRFEEIREFLLDRHMSLFENPDHGWSLQLAPWEHELFPEPGEALQIALDEVRVPFSIKDAPVTTTYTHRLPSGELHTEDRVETKRVIAPADDHVQSLLQWIEHHHDLPKARAKKAKSLLDPRNLYKDNVLRLMVRVVGAPDKGRYAISPSSFGAL